MSKIDCLRSIVDEGNDLIMAEVYRDNDLGSQCVGIRLQFSASEIFVHAEGADDTIVLSSTLPAILLDKSIRKFPAPTEWAPAIGQPILWAWAMINTQDKPDGIQIEFGTIDHPSITLQAVVRASTLVVRTL